MSGYGRYGDLKSACADAVVDALDPVRRRHDQLMGDVDELTALLARGAQRAAEVADRTLGRARAAIGLVGARR